MSCKLRRCQGRRGCICPKRGPRAPKARSSNKPCFLPAPARSKHADTLTADLYGTIDGDGFLPAPTKKPSQRSVGAATKKRSTTKPIKKKAAASPAKTGTSTAKTGTAKKAKAKAKAEEAPGPSSSTADVPKAEPPAPTGTAVFRYNHYKKTLQITGGAISCALLDEEFAFSYAYEGNYAIHCSGPGKGDGSRRLPRSGGDGSAARITGLDIGSEYWCEIEEDDEAESKRESRTFKATNTNTGIRAGGGDDDGMLGGEDSASCSCIEGNPCMSPYNCKNWSKRFEIAKANGWKGHS